MDLTIAGIVLGLITTIGLLIMLVWILDPKSKGNSTSTMLISGGIGVAFCTAVNWFPIWIPIFVGLIVAFVIINPFASVGD